MRKKSERLTGVSFALFTYPSYNNFERNKYIIWKADLV
ncbi:hypothetical protein ADIAL_0851 [Alkalibacterium sp. AK22]|nr:hypothetical protein ADIAL_0851 [Alkalibacterium sp. AK22]